MDGTRVYLWRVYNNLPAAGATYQNQINHCAVLVQLLDDEDDGRAQIIQNLLNVNFAEMRLDDLTRSIIEWKNLFGRIRDLIGLCKIRLGAIAHKRFRVDSGLGDIHLEVGQVISRAIARLFLLQNVQLAPELGLDEFFQ
jgi:hypothetical protein